MERRGGVTDRTIGLALACSGVQPKRCHVTALQFPAWNRWRDGVEWGMAGGKTGWTDSKLIARAILHDRVARRKVIWRMLMFVLLQMAAGLWLVDGVLAASPWYFLLWWGACALVTCGVMLFALYDALAVIREERHKNP